MTKTELNFFLLEDTGDRHLVTIESAILPQIGSTMFIDTIVDGDWFNNNFPDANLETKVNYLNSRFRGKVRILYINSGIKSLDVSSEFKTSDGTYILPAQEYTYYHDIQVKKI